MIDKGSSKDDSGDGVAVAGVVTILQSLTSRNPAQYVSNFDEDENRGGITLIQLRNALFRVLKGNDKTKYIAMGTTVKFLQKYDGRKWRFDVKTGLISPIK